MQTVRRAAWRKAAALLWTAWLCGARAAAPDPASTPVAHSALVTLEAAYTAQGLELRVQRATDRGALSVSALTVAIDGHDVPAAALGDGSWLVPLGAARGRRLEVVLVHDGIRELLSGALPAAAAGAPASSIPAVLRDHQQLAWWVLNITVVLIAALALSRRKP